MANPKITKDGFVGDLQGTASYAMVADKLTTKSTGDTYHPIYLDNGVPKQVSALYEADLKWGGKNLSGSYGPIDAALVPQLGANRLAYYPPNSIDVEYSRNNGATWTSYGATNAQKVQLFLNGSSTELYIGGRSETGVDKSKHQLRITIKNTFGNLYTELNKFVLRVSSAGSQGCWCTIDGITQANVESGTDAWEVFVEKAGIAGWSGYSVINTPSITTYGNVDSKHNQYSVIRFTFGCTSHDTAYEGLFVQNILGFGGTGWVTPSTLADQGVPYMLGPDQSVAFPGCVEADGFSCTYHSSDDAVLLAGGGCEATGSLTVGSAISASNVLWSGVVNKPAGLVIDTSYSNLKNDVAEIKSKYVNVDSLNQYVPKTAVIGGTAAPTWGETATAGTVDGKEFKVTMPENPVDAKLFEVKFYVSEDGNTITCNKTFSQVQNFINNLSDGTGSDLQFVVSIPVLGINRIPVLTIDQENGVSYTLHVPNPTNPDGTTVGVKIKSDNSCEAVGFGYSRVSEEDYSLFRDMVSGSKMSTTSSGTATIYTGTVTTVSLNQNLAVTVRTYGPYGRPSHDDFSIYYHGDAILRLIVGSTVYSVTWPSGLYWANGEVPTLEANTVYEFSFASLDKSSSSYLVAYQAFKTV